jgi:quinoprotein relay system zinc metallohydrolase 2
MARTRPLIALALLVFACPPGHATQAVLPFTLTQVAPGDYVRQGECAEATPQNLDGIANIGFVVGQDAVAVIDPGGSLADGQRLRAAIASVTKLPVRYVIMTHSHPDHVFGAGAFLADHPAFVGHVRLPAALAARGEYDRKRLAAVLGDAATGQAVMPTMLVSDTTTIDLGSRRLILQAHAPAHTDSDLTVLDEGSSTLWAGDLLFVGRIPALDGDLKGWLSVLHALEAVPAARAVPGHGPASVPWPAGAADEARYLGALLHDVRAAIAQGQDVDEATGHAAQGERGRWKLFDDYNGRNTIVAYKELQWE